jgi:MFS family permease
MLAALFGAVVGQAVTFYTATFYAFYFLERIARVDAATVTVLTGIAIAIGAPLVLACGWLSDRIGRKPPLLAGLALAVLLYFPIFGALLDAANPALSRARAEAPVSLRADPAECALQFDPMGRRAFDGSSCDIARSFLARSGIGHATFSLASPSPARLEIGGVVMAAPDPARLPAGARAVAIADFERRARAALAAAGHGLVADPAAVDRPRVVALLVALLFITALVTGPYSALLAELFPARIRYTALSFPQNFGNGWFGGLLPAIAFTIVAATGNVFAGLWYPVGLAALCLAVGALALPETRGRPIDR